MRFLLLLTLVAFSSLIKSNSCRIDFQIKGLENNKIILAHYYGSRQIIDDTIILDEHGKGFIARKRLDGGMYLCIFPNKKFFDLLINDEQFFTVITDTSNTFDQLTIEGAWETNEYLKYQRLIKKLNDLKTTDVKAGKLEIESYCQTLIKQHPNSYLASYFNMLIEPQLPMAIDVNNKKNGRDVFTQRYSHLITHYWNHTNFADSRLIKTNLIYEKCDFYFNKLLKQQADSIINAIDSFIAKTRINDEFYRWALGFLINNYKSAHNTEIEKVYVYIAENYYLNGKTPWADKRYIDMLRQRVASISPLITGSKAPNLILESIQGKEISIYQTEANMLVLYFWSPDCPVCLSETPKLASVYKQYKSMGLKVIAIYTHADRLMWEKYTTENNFGFINAYDPLLKNNFTKLYQITSTPQLFLLNKQKEIIAKKINTSQLADMLKLQLSK